jgi:hypothetical protein
MSIRDLDLSEKRIEWSLLHLIFLPYYWEIIFQKKRLEFLCHLLKDPYHIRVLPVPQTKDHCVSLLIIGGTYKKNSLTIKSHR